MTLHGRNCYWNACLPVPKCSLMRGEDSCNQYGNGAFRPAGCLFFFSYSFQTERLFFVFTHILNHLLEIKCFLLRSLHHCMLLRPEQAKPPKPMKRHPSGLVVLQGGSVYYSHCVLDAFAVCQSCSCVTSDTTAEVTSGLGDHYFSTAVNVHLCICTEEQENLLQGAWYAD